MLKKFICILIIGLLAIGCFCGITTAEKIGSSIHQEPPHPKPLALTCAITSPNGGEVIPAGYQFNITWTISGGTAPYSSSLNFYEDTTGTTRYTVTNGCAKLYFLWTVPNFPSLTCRMNITVSDSAVPANYAWDNSNAYWVIQPLPIHMNVYSPLGGENWTSGTTHLVEVTMGGGYGTLHLYFEVTWDDGLTFYFIKKI